MRNKLVWCFLLFCHTAFCQKETNNWFFGDSVSLDFNSGAPIPGRGLASGFAMSSSSDSNGNLLLYTNGVSVWNRNNIRMPNGFSLRDPNGNSYTSLIVPNPGNSNLFYVFSINEFNGPVSVSLQYAIVDMSLQGGLGDVTNKNIPLLNPAVGIIAGVKTCDGLGYWVVAHEWGTKNFYSYLINASGVNTTPVISTIGSIHNTGASKQMKISPDGTMLATTLEDWSASDDNKLEVFHFNNSTGLVYSLIFSVATQYLPFEYIMRDLGGVEFSPDNTKLYSTNRDSNPAACIYQFDLKAGSSGQIQQSATIVGTPRLGELENLQLASDGKIYIAKGGGSSSSLGCIQNPNNPGTSCNFVEESIYFGRLVYSVPSFIQSYFNNPIKPEIIYSDTCLSEGTKFSISNISRYDSLRWNFNDPNSNVSNSSILPSPVHQFTSTGSYSVSLSVYLCNQVTVYSKYLLITSKPQVNLGNDTTLCTGDTLILHMNLGYNRYLWSNNITTNNITVKNEGKYWGRLTNNGCISTDTININFLNYPTINIGKDTTLCIDSTYILNPDNNRSSQYLWSTNSTTPIITIDSSGAYWVRASNSHCVTSDTINIVFGRNKNMSIRISKDTVSYLEGVQFNALGNNILNYSWNFNDGTLSNQQNPYHIFTKSGNYDIIAEGRNINGCTITKRLPVFVLETLIIPNLFTPNSDNLNDNFKIIYNGKEPFHIEIYSRWGEKLYMSTEKSDYWDGGNQTDGIYYYKLSIGRNDYKGWVHMFR